MMHFSSRRSKSVSVNDEWETIDDEEVNEGTLLLMQRERTISPSPGTTSP